MIDAQQVDSLKKRLAHILWIGGSTCAGKSTIAERLAERYQLPAYFFDRREPFHIYRSIPEQQPHLIGFMAMTMDERWVLRSPEAMALHTIASWSTERFPMVLDDLSSMPAEAPIIAEGPGLFPQQVAPLLTRPNQGIWLVASRDLIEQVRHARPGLARMTSDPERTMRNIIDRDILIADHVRQGAQTLGLPHIEVDLQNIHQAYAMVEKHFAEALPAP
jgi:hypothetical protein